MKRKLNIKRLLKALKAIAIIENKKRRLHFDENEGTK